MSTSIIRKRFRYDDVLTDMTSVKLSNEAGTYGVIRNDTSAVVVADDTTMTHISTGVYEYSWTDPAYDLVYTVWIEYVYDGETYWIQSTKYGATTAGTLSMTWATICDRIEQLTGNTTAGNALIHAISGYRRFLRGVDLDAKPPLAHAWSFLRPLATITIGAAQTGTATGDSSGVVTATTDMFDTSMVGLVMTVTDVGDVTIEDWVQADIVNTTGSTAFSSKAISVSSTGIYDLPAAFGGIVNPFTYVGSQTDQTPALLEVTPETIFRMWRDDGRADDAFCWALAPATMVVATGQRWKLLVAPVPDASRVLAYRHRVSAAIPQDTNTYPVGGADGSDVILACGLADAEVKVGKLTNGPLEMDARDRMAEAIATDVRFMRIGTAKATTGGDPGRPPLR